ncbi:helix-turn-helix transcriptional regulator [Leadbettera azotonutricia]|uniref:Molybdopterin cofactor synthesis/binding domain protein n=1 Tax=Leadbettera azotonutricia (strain ATCC BAA-888 / DSM 13862 / ZAS-9) TaxID=545695 RepID=F5YEN6_LEAAZ|nr:helix-turn-helix transcriptional regulator [Leadbettera azotonutricia]AEF82772.1 molybdopterin cofactor synthesis/binding domain protein [Leadbettera azotonutricia ZAS-9]
MVSTLLTAEDVAHQLRIKKLTVYGLIKRGELSSSRVGKQVRVSQADINSYLEASKTGPGTKSAPAELPAERGTSIIISGQDACIDLMMSKIAGTGEAVLRSYMGCYNSLFALYNGRITMAASHLWDAETDTYNYPYMHRLLPGLRVGVLRLAGRMQGFYVKENNPLNIKDWQDLARPGITMINREKGCGTRILLDQKLAGLDIDTSDIQGYTRESSSHLACAGIVAKGGADLGCGCARGAESIKDINFIPLQLEWYDFVFRLSDKNTSAVRSISSYVGSPEFKQDLEILGGYDISQTGRYEEF